MSRERLKKVVKIIALIAIIIGWLLANYSNYRVILNIVAPKYCNAIDLYNRIIDGETIFEKDRKGFYEVSEIFRSQITPKPVPEIIRFRVLGYGRGLGGDTILTIMQSQPLIGIRATFIDGRQVEGDICNLKNKISEKYLNSRIFHWANAVFWLGIVVEAVFVFVFKGL